MTKEQKVLRDVIMMAVSNHEKNTLERISGITMTNEGDEFTGGRSWDFNFMTDPTLHLVNLNEKSKEGNMHAWVRAEIIESSFIKI